MVRVGRRKAERDDRGNERYDVPGRKEEGKTERELTP